MSERLNPEPGRRNSIEPRFCIAIEGQRTGTVLDECSLEAER